MAEALAHDDAANQQGGVASAHRNKRSALILMAARKLFLDQGFDAVSMDMVARQTPVSKATLYAHFASKEDLFTAVVVDEADRIAEEIWRIVPEGGNVDEVLRHVAGKFV